VTLQACIYFHIEEANFHAIYIPWKTGIDSFITLQNRDKGPGNSRLI